MNPELLEGICAKIESHYVMADRVPAIKERLGDRVKSGAYASLEGEALAEAVTDDLRDVSGDVHFKLAFRSEARPHSAADVGETAEEVAEFRRIARFNGYGCERVERLPGNVGLWRISEFYDLIDGSGPAFVAAMRLLESTDALIVDVRGNSGGDPATVALACSFFFDVEPVHLNTLESDQGRVQRQWWTLPHLECDRYLAKRVFVLIDERTFSAAEEFAYDLQALGRATTVGARSGGGAHLRESYPIDEHFSINVPVARAVNPHTLGNWESVGVQPDVAVDPERGLEAAHCLALRSLSEGELVGEAADEARSALAELVAAHGWLSDMTA